MSKRKLIALILGPLLFLLILLLLRPDGLDQVAVAVIGCTVWMAIWWVTEAVPIPMTSLLPLILFPTTGIMTMKEVAPIYSSPIIYIFIGGFILALAMEKWNLHRRIALSIVSFVGTDMHQIILGFILATGFLSMWISNTATTVMMLPIGLAIVKQFGDFLGKNEQGDDPSIKFGKALILGIAYSASIGGTATLIGTPTNIIFTGFLEETYGISIPFGTWMLYGVPIAVILWTVIWQHLSRIVFKVGKGEIKGSKDIIDNQLRALGKIGFEEKWVLIVFSLVAFFWIFRQAITNVLPGFKSVNDGIIALVGAFVLFIIPSSNRSKSIMDWETALRLPWGVLLLFGGAFAVAAAFEVSGLAAFIAGKLTLLSEVPFILLLLCIITVVIFMTEIAQNMATCALMLPIMAQLSIALEVHPYSLLVGTCVAASCAFMLPVATAPNAVVFGSGFLKISDMARAGFLLNVFAIIIVVVFSYFLLPIFWGINLNEVPEAFLQVKP